MAPRPLVELRNVRLEVDGRRYLDGANLRVDEGESVVIAGPPGCGKSFVPRIVLGLPGMDGVPVQVSGAVDVDGHEVLTISEVELQAARRTMGSVLRDGGLIENMDVRRNIALPLHYHYRDHIGPSQIEARCDAVLTDMELLHLGQTGIRPVALHRQERLYVSLARALVCDPVLLLLDDPVATLSPAAAHRLCRYCFVYHPAFDTDLPDVEPRRPRTRLVTCSDLGPYLDFGDRFLLLVDGRLEEIGTRTDVLTSSDPRVRALQSASATASMAEETVGG